MVVCCLLTHHQLTSLSGPTQQHKLWWRCVAAVADSPHPVLSQIIYIESRFPLSLLVHSWRWHIYIWLYPEVWTRLRYLDPPSTSAVTVRLLVFNFNRTTLLSFNFYILHLYILCHTSNGSPAKTQVAVFCSIVPPPPFIASKINSNKS